MIDNPDTCPFHWGDRVDHNKFGLGTVDGKPTASTNAAKVKTWLVPIRWDDTSRSAGKVVGEFIRLVHRPDAKGGAFWANEHTDLVDAAVAKLRDLEHALRTSFRPKSGSAIEPIERAILELEANLDSVRDFVLDDEAGKHH